jgi:hypothetical protein
MNNEHHETLPPQELPVPEIKGVERGGKIDNPTASEHAGAQAIERGHSTAVAPAHHASQQPIANPVNQHYPASPVASPTIQAPHSPAMADDSDLIEREWVQKAKDIVAATNEDPYRQNKEMGHYKATYVKKRFNKDIRVSEQ